MSIHKKLEQLTERENEIKELHEAALGEQYCCRATLAYLDETERRATAELDNLETNKLAMAKEEARAEGGDVVALLAKQGVRATALREFLSMAPELRNSVTADLKAADKDVAAIAKELDAIDTEIQEAEQQKEQREAMISAHALLLGSKGGLVKKYDTLLEQFPDLGKRELLKIMGISDQSHEGSTLIQHGQHEEAVRRLNAARAMQETA